MNDDLQRDLSGDDELLMVVNQLLAPMPVQTENGFTERVMAAMRTGMAGVPSPAVQNIFHFPFPFSIRSRPRWRCVWRWWEFSNRRRLIRRLIWRSANERTAASRHLRRLHTCKRLP